ncbi:MAG TPA: GNAT family N-acetyltransferase [Candidatus Binataceae bacterium]|nr:GNAT family N-acetyltransferase [Candidatus Binataceae bacterium]
MGNEAFRIVAATSSEKMAAAYSIRRRVFIEEQRVPEEIELDADDARAFHAIALRGGDAVGCGRYVEHGAGEVKIGRMAVLRELRGTGIGRAILEFLVRTARERGYRRAILHAQLTAEGFYLRQGFRPFGQVFEEAGIAHRAMSREL